MFCLAMKQITRNISAFVKHREPDYFVDRSAGEAMKLKQVPSSGQKYFIVDFSGSEKCSTTELVEVHYCAIVNVEDDLTP